MNKTITNKFGFLAALLVLVALVYVPGINGPFVFDDSINIVTNTAVHMTQFDLASLSRAALSDEGTIFKRPLATMSFALNHLAGGLEPYGYKLINIGIHLANTVLVYWLAIIILDVFTSRRNTGRTRLHAWIPLISAAIWALHPIQLTSVLYVVQRMTSLSALFVLAGLIVFLIGRRGIDTGRQHSFALMVAGIGGGTLLGVLSKENAVLLPLFALLLEITFFRFVTGTPESRRRLFLFYGVIVGLPLLAAAAWLMINPTYITGGYRWRDFTLDERLLTQPRVLWFYVSLFLFPDIRRYSLYYDDIEISTGLLMPVATLVAMAGLAAAVVVALYAYRRAPWLFLGISWFLAGHLIESSAIALELVHIHRNYVPTVGLALASGYGLVYLLNSLTQPKLATVLMLSVCMTLAAITASYASIWREEESLAQFMLRYRPLSARAHVMLASARVNSGDDPLSTLMLFQRAVELAPTETAYLIRVAEVAARSLVHMRDKHPAPGQSLTEHLPPELSEYLVVHTSSGKSRLWLKPAMIDKVRSQLRDLPVKSMTEQTLVSIATCVTDDVGDCAPFYDEIVNWINIALSNPRILHYAKRNLTLTLGKLYFEFGQFHLVTKLAETARQSDPKSVQLAIMHANALYVLGQRAQAGNILSAFADTHPNEITRARAEILRLMNSLSGNR